MSPQESATLILLNWQAHRHLPKHQRPIDYEQTLEAVREEMARPNNINNERY